MSDVQVVKNLEAKKSPGRPRYLVTDEMVAQVSSALSDGTAKTRKELLVSSQLTAKQLTKTLDQLLKAGQALKQGAKRGTKYLWAQVV